VIGRDGVAENAKRVSALDFGYAAGAIEKFSKNGGS